MGLNVMDSPVAAGADSAKLLMEEKHSEESNSRVSARAKQGQTVD